MRIALGIEYNGSNYHGWQRQKDPENIATVQATVEEALSKVADHPVTLICAGRTDAGVHAQNQITHFDSTAKRRLDAWVLGGNANLPPDIKIRWAKEVDAKFHARFSAIARRYRYLIYNNKVSPAILHNQVTWHIPPLDIERMQAAAQYFIGKHDFSSFRGSGCQANTPIRNIHHLKIEHQSKLITLDIKANAFLLHMVRNIAGVLMTIGAGKQEPIWAKEVLETCDRRAASITAPSAGLYLANIYYPQALV